MDLDEFQSEIKNVNNGWKSYFESDIDWVSFIWDGENYISFKLIEMLEKRMASFIRQIAPDNIEDEEVEVEVV